MLVRALVPAGYMFAPTTDGRYITVTLCSGHGAVDAVVDIATGAIVDGDASKGDTPAKARGDTPCVFAAAAPLADAVTPQAIDAPNQTIIAARVRSASFAPGRGLAAPPPWATGPPITV